MTRLAEISEEGRDIVNRLEVSKLIKSARGAPRNYELNPSLHALSRTPLEVVHTMAKKKPLSNLARLGIPNYLFPSNDDDNSALSIERGFPRTPEEDYPSKEEEIKRPPYQEELQRQQDMDLMRMLNAQLEKELKNKEAVAQLALEAEAERKELLRLRISRTREQQRGMER